LALATRRAGLLLLAESNKGRLEARERSIVGDAAFFLVVLVGVEEAVEKDRLMGELLDDLPLKAPLALAPAAPLLTEDTSNARPPMRILFGLAAEEVTVFLEV